MPVTWIDTTAHNPENFEVSPETQPLLWQMEEKHFWHAARNEWILETLARYAGRSQGQFLEVGCGSGAVAVALARAGYDFTGVDTSEACIRKAAERLPHAHLICGEVMNLPETLRCRHDFLGFFDVFEHLQEPETLLRQSLEYAKPGAWVIATVPASQDFYSIVDTVAGHKRRYETSELKQLFENVGLTDVKEHGVFRLLAPILSLQRTGMEKSSPEEIRRRQTKVPFFALNKLLHLACKAERTLGFALSENKSGSSLIAVGRKALQ